ncbi:hypothetical protein [Actinokineospora cianjurensis]|uniref:DUF3558 domain-containing protein n=1 Tax=Actinokineospora cianjurensis TaxID=585224 RepID=A0A421B1W6_9PSEU|nr:hypothetical protein [Actinokineospora cianjurensis]RLK58360.1 hypothetical protein CLV68_4458 [Actinokineospora cianjurensis]
MRTVRQGQAAAALVAVAAALGVAACTTISGGNTASGRAGSAVTDGSGKDRQAAERRGDRTEGSIVLGDLDRPKTAQELGAPFDPCKDLSWNDFPAQVRPDPAGPPNTPRLGEVAQDDAFDIRCVWSNHATAHIGTDGTSRTGRRFVVSIVWAAGDKLDADPTGKPDVEAKTWNGKAGLLRRVPANEDGKNCLGMARLGNGVGGAAVTDGRFGIDPCVVVEALMNAITARAR